MSAAISQKLEPEPPGIRLVLNVTGAGLLAAAVMLLAGYLGNSRFTAPADPVLQVSTRWVFGGFGGLCVGLAAACLLAKSTRLVAGLLLWMGINAAIYVLGCHWVGHATMGLYLMPLESTFGLPLWLGRWLLGALLISLLFAGGYPLLWPRLRRGLGLAEYLKMFCPACGGHIKFDLRNLGQMILCPHCQAAVTLRRPENLKIACGFCLGHVEFPTHALGRKIACPHCKRRLALELPERAVS
jgi:hypothetical protein